MSIERTLDRFVARSCRIGFILWCLPVAALAALGPEVCGSLKNPYGPEDYRTADRARITIVTDHHFTTDVELLIKGNAGYIGSDLDYTLRAIPNHPRALVSMTRYGERLSTDKVPNANYPVECYYERAVRFRPDDTTVRMLFAAYLAKQKRKDEALFHLGMARAVAGESAFTHYNLGLSYLELGQHELAAAEAREARALGFPRTDLIERLKAAGKWVDPPQAAPSSPQPATAASSPP